MRPDRAWVLLNSGKRLNLLDPTLDSWADSDLAIGLSRTYRWGGHSCQELPLSVAQHSLLVMVLRQQMQPHQPLTRGEALRELLHDGHEGFLGFDPIFPVKAHLGADFEMLADRLQTRIDERYGLPMWKGDDPILHKRADRLAAASEALHVAGWSRAEIHDVLNIDLAPVMVDPLPAIDGLRDWEPWPARLAALLFLSKLRELTCDTGEREWPADLGPTVARERTIARLARAFLQLPPDRRRRSRARLTGSSLTDTYVYAAAHDSSQHVEGLIVDGEHDEDGQWLLDQSFTIFTDDEQILVCQGHNCDVEIQ